MTSTIKVDTIAEHTSGGGVTVDGLTIKDGGITATTGATVFNEASADVDFRVESNGKTHMLFVDGGENRIGIGSNSPTRFVQLTDTSADMYLAFEGGTSNTVGILLGDTDDHTQSRIQHANSDNSLRFSTVQSEAMRIDSSQRVGIGTVSPARSLHVNSADANVASFEGDKGEGLVISSGTDGQIDIIGYDDGASSYNKLIIRANGSGNNIEVNTDGSVTMPLQPAFQVRPSSNQNNMAAGDTIALGTEVFDQNADFASNTFTAPVTGKYQLSFNIRLQELQSDSGYVLINIETSNRTYQHILAVAPHTDGNVAYQHFSNSLLCDMDANDTAYLKFSESGGTTGQVDVSAAESNFTGYLAC